MKSSLPRRIFAAPRLFRQRLALLLSTLPAVFFFSGLAMVHGQSYSIDKRTPSQAGLTVDISRSASHPVSPWLFGKFSEHLGNNIYGGLWSEVLDNPGLKAFEQVEKSPKDTLAKLQGKGASDTLNAISRNVAHRWQPFGAEGVSFSFTTRDALSQPHSQLIEVPRELPDFSGLRQLVRLPTERCDEYELVLHLRREGPEAPAVGIQLRHDKSDTVVFQQTIQDYPRQWQEYRFKFKVPAKTFNAYWLEIGTRGPGSFAIDGLSLMPTDNARGWDPVAIQLIRDSGCTMMRFPGGNFVSGYHWRDGIGDPYRRPSLPNPAWDGVIESNRVGSNEWIDFFELTGCEPLLCINAGNGTPQEALAWVRYLTDKPTGEYGRLRATNGNERPLPLHTVELGNELYGEWQVGFCDAETYARRYHDFYSLLEKAFPDMHFIANGGAKFQPQWNDELLRVNRKDVELISIHYLFDNNVARKTSPDDFYLTAMVQTYGLEAELNEMRRQWAKYSPGAKLAVTELMLFPQDNSATHANAKTFGEALWYSGFINSCMRQGDFVSIITYSASMNHGASLQKTFEQIFPTPGWLAYELYATNPNRYPCSFNLRTPFFDVPATFKFQKADEAPVIDAFALTNASKDSLTLFIANRSLTDTLSLPVSIEGATFNKARIDRLAADTPLDQNSVANQDNITIESAEMQVNADFTLDLPKLSFMRVTFSR